MKYITQKNGDFVIFPDTMTHSVVAHELRLTKEHIAGAGFIRFGCGDHQELEILVDCYGESVSLGVKSRGKEDARIIENSHNRY
jgi:hypothetical protein